MSREQMEVERVPLKKTPRMLEAEERVGQSLEDCLPSLVTEYGLSNTSKMLGITPSLLRSWLHRLGISTEFIAIGPADEMRITRKPVEGPIMRAVGPRKSSRR